ncbi:Hypothetical_protein [Hexamita inflata]|uniref:Hypothetical_protein n=1 Tax=Hexamita inflata TaxID=28002 RepID=A0AA86RID1_9EUKA|nr:Hypothetical protein HINF_LOCUS2830 [Hexamita inflata]CAI9977107.1 Hypothetical protein HINF_LOCUS64752 [Hexamita inflata]
MYSVTDNEIILKTHKLCTIQERDEESWQESPRMSRCSSEFEFDGENDSELQAIEVINLLKLTNYSLQTVQNAVSHVEFHFELLERNIKRVTKNCFRLMVQLELQE